MGLGCAGVDRGKKGEGVMSFRSGLMIPVILAAVAQAACLELQTTNGSGGAGGSGTTTGGPGTSTSASGSTSSGAASCAASSNNCEECTTCSTMSPLGSCVAEHQACGKSSACVLIGNCLVACPPGSFTCWDTCLSMYPDGANLFIDFDVCVFCKECNEACADAQLCFD